MHKHTSAEYYAVGRGGGGVGGLRLGSPLSILLAIPASATARLHPANVLAQRGFHPTAPKLSHMADMTAPAPGQFDAQAPGVTAASGSASERLEGDLHSLEQQLAELQVRRQCASLLW